MDVLNRLTIKNLKLNKKRTIVTIMGIILSVALISAVAGMFFSAKESFRQYEIELKGDYHYSFDNRSEDEIQIIRQNRKIEQVYVVEKEGYALLQGIQNENKPYAYITSMTKEGMENLGIRLEEGRLPENENEILLPKHVRTDGRLNLQLGDTLILEVGTRVSASEELNQSDPFAQEGMEQIIDTTKKEYKIVGVMERLSGELEDYAAPGYNFVTFQNRETSQRKNTVYVRLNKDGLKKPEEVRDGLAKIGEHVGENSYLLTIETGVIGDSTLRSLAVVAMAVVLIIIVTSVFCIKNSFDISITEKIRQYGMLASIGATKKQIRKNVYYEAFLLGLVGLPAGILSGIFAAFVLMHVANYVLKDILNIELIFSFSWYAVLLAVILGTVTIFLSARKSAVKASKITPIQAIRNSDDIKIQSSKIKCPKIISRVFGVGGEISYKNLKRSRKKYRTTVISITVSVTVFVALSYFMEMAYHTLETEIQRMDYNISVIYREDETMPDFVDEIYELENVNEISAMSVAGFSVDSEHLSDDYKNFQKENISTELEEQTSITAFVLDERAYKEYLEQLHLDYEEMKDKGILLNSIFQTKYDEEKEMDINIEMEQFDFKKGDIIKGWVDLLGGDESAPVSVEVELGCIAKESPLGLPENSIAANLLVGEHFAEKICTTAHYNYIYLNADNSDKTQDELEEIFGAMYLEQIGINNVAEQARQTESLFLMIGIFLYGFITVITLIGVTNIINTITTNMSLRKREFAMLRSIGMTTREFNRMIILESVFYGTKSLVIGAPLGCLLAYVMHEIMQVSDLILKFEPPLGAVFVSAVAVFLLLTVIMKYSIGKINRQNTIETIRNENI